jgi:hypothetical protein
MSTPPPASAEETTSFFIGTVATTAANDVSGDVTARGGSSAAAVRGSVTPDRDDVTAGEFPLGAAAPEAAGSGGSTVDIGSPRSLRS